MTLYGITPPIPHHCRTCERPLEFKVEWYPTGGTIYRWQHITFDPNGPLPFPHDVDPVPDVEQPDTEVLGVCDFCSAPNPRWGYKARDFETVSYLTLPPAGAGLTENSYGSAGAWAACDECADLVDADDFDGILDRAMAGNPSARLALTQGEIDARRGGLAAMFRNFKAAKLSGRLPVEEA